jgi:hypothetical protein
MYLQQYNLVLPKFMMMNMMRMESFSTMDILIVHDKSPTISK